MTSENQPSVRSLRKRLALWPLITLPFVGLVAGFVFPTERFGVAEFNGVLLVPPAAALLGALLGCGLMVAVGTTVLAYRLGGIRSTIGTMLFMTAVIAVLLALIRSLVR